MKSLKESLFDSKTQTAMESLFDKDLIKRKPPMDMETATSMVRDHIEKEIRPTMLHTKGILDVKIPDKLGLYCYWNDAYDNGELDMEHIYLFNLITDNFNDPEKYGPCVCICISREKYNDEIKIALSRVDVAVVELKNHRITSSRWKCLWDGNQYKQQTKLKTPFFDSKSLNDILKYIEKLCKTTIEAGRHIYDYEKENRFYF